MITTLILAALFSFSIYASEPSIDFNRKWEYTRLEFLKDRDGVFGTKYFKRYIKAGNKHWPVAELLYYQKDNSSQKINLNTIIERKKKMFEGTDWVKSPKGKAIVWRGFSKKINRLIEIYAWKRNSKGYGITLSFTRRGYFKSINRELAYIHQLLQNPKSKITSLVNLIIDTAYAEDGLQESNMIFSETMMETAVASGKIIPILSEDGQVIMIMKDQANEAQIITFETVKKQYMDILDERENYLKDKQREAQRLEREREAQAEEQARLNEIEEQAALELEALKNREALMNDYKTHEQKLQKEKQTIVELEMMADELLLILEEIESEQNSGGTVEDLIVKYSEETGRKANLDCIDCATEESEMFPTGFANRVLNFLQDVRKHGRDPKMEFCKKFEEVIRMLIALEHFNQEARVIILGSSVAFFEQFEEEQNESQERYDRINSSEFAKEKQAILARLTNTVNRADREWMRENKKPFMEDCRQEKYSNYEGDDPLMKTSYELAKEIVDSHNPIKNIEDFFFNFFCFDEACKIKRACKKVYKEALLDPIERPRREETNFAPNAMVMRQQLADAVAYFEGLEKQLECYKRLGITYDTRNFSSARHLTDPSSIPECRQEGAEDAVKLYNLKKKLLNKFNEQECPKKMDDFYRNLTTSDLIFPEGRSN